MYMPAAKRVKYGLSSGGRPPGAAENQACLCRQVDLLFMGTMLA
jgi:hypothetical protein